MGPDGIPDCGAVEPVAAEEARELLGAEKLTRAHVGDFGVFPRARWVGRCAVPHDEQGRPQEIHFGGHSGD
ncbi:hypothetical protein [Streptomyces ferrugineus]|uniref:hypothetical protein n=1 Tax=Streptomyces ferrugineus TaxID=1413221 RepID=UPI001D13E4F7|nr:hypothetical protein [Streptomyces ferrugineus]